MARWRVRKYEWEANKRVVEEEVIEADDVCTVDGALVFARGGQLICPYSAVRSFI